MSYNTRHRRALPTRIFEMGNLTWCPPPTWSSCREAAKQLGAFSGRWGTQKLECPGRADAIKRILVRRGGGRQMMKVGSRAKEGWGNQSSLEPPEGIQSCQYLEFCPTQDPSWTYWLHSNPFFCYFGDEEREDSEKEAICPRPPRGQGAQGASAPQPPTRRFGTTLQGRALSSVQTPSFAPGSSLLGRLVNHHIPYTHRVLTLHASVVIFLYFSLFLRFCS